MPERSKALILPLLCLLPWGCGNAGVDAYEQGRFRDAQAAFGQGSSAADLYNRALAALRAGDLRDAESSAKQAATAGGPEIAALCDFLRGNAAFALCEMAELQASTAAAEPFAVDVAIAYAAKAGRLWQTAAMSRTDWPEARRNVERALLKLEELKKRKAKAERPPSKDPEPQPQPKPTPSGNDSETTEEDAQQKPQLGELSPEEVSRLIEKLAEKEREKLALRRSHRKARMAGVERDW